MKSILIKLINIIISPKLQPVLTAKMLFYASLETEKWETFLRLNQSKWFCNFSCQLVQIPSKNLILAEKSFNKRNTRILKIIWLFKIVFVYTYKPVNLKGNQPWILIRRTDAEAEFPILWTLGAKSRFIGKDPDAGKDWRQKKRVIEGEMVGWHHRFNGNKLGQTLGGGKGSLRNWGKPGTLQSMVSQRVGHHPVSERWQ